MTDRGDPVSHRVTETSEEIEAFWRAQEPVIAAQDAAVNAVLPAIIGRDVDQARHVVADEAARAGVGLTLRVIAPGTVVNAMFQHGRITAIVRDGAIESAAAG